MDQSRSRTSNEIDSLTQRNSTLFTTIKALKELDHPDYNRIAREICEFYQYDEISIQNALQQIGQDKPWEYICGFATFMGNKFTVNDSVLIPRIETEVLVSRVISDLSKVDQKSKIHFVDVGTGSGCIIISLCSELAKSANYSYTAIDSSAEALQVAKQNASSILGKRADEIGFIKSDLLSNFPITKSDLIIFIANLPYLTQDQLDVAERSVSDWEPHLALLGGGDDGLDLVNELLDQTKNIRIPHKMYLELDPAQVVRFVDNIPVGYTRSTSFNDQFDRNRFLILE